ncbi:methyltransferase family protein [Pinibacter aurantiacus]|uniref:Isoprenylcysteine carboxylmethyltransferase family protein n=1 Tax=Pinibacter aurantiacus TaxID=2851599 RepID=A0A9E2S7E9_9BACT|nr:isoprenylcysteine carboxylmethyltransferase family protein [Pinibacter aurantiacus]MBV4357998.1 isoprenylcysteine carboxylmethyltransferase family protein [Pinibacter aurantiacus]
MTSLFLRNLFFTILQPGVVAGLVPYFIIRDKISEILSLPFAWFHFLGILIFAIGLFITLHCITRFAIDGKGTLSPADPTKKLVIRGLYKYTRNPMYVGVMLILIGEAIFFASFRLLMYSGIVFSAFTLFVIYFEEPRLKRDFGEEYAEYRKRVRRWI